MAQAGALWVRDRRIRWALLLGGAAAIAAMFYVLTLPLPDDAGANIGAGVLFLWLLVSLGLVAAGVVADVWHSRRGVAAGAPGVSSERSHRWSKAALASSVVVALLPLSVVLVVVPLATVALAWWREPPSRLRLVAAAAAALAAGYLLL